MNPFAELDEKILRASSGSDELGQNLVTLCEDIGPRFAGTDGYRKAAEFMLARFKAYGLDAALEEFEFTAWHRGEGAQFSMVEPTRMDYRCYALPYGNPTGPGGITARLVDIGKGTPEEVEAARERIAGQFVMTDGSGRHRREIYAHSQDAGAAGFVLVNRAPGGLLQTGSVGDGGMGGLPAVNIALETAQEIQAQLEAGDASFHLVMGGSCEPSETWNVVGEIKGTDSPEELVIMGGHLDSHEISPGAFDNAAGSAVVMEVARLLGSLSGALKRTVRLIGFAGEEVGLLGSHHHARAHAEELQKARFMLNCDMPSSGKPYGLAFHDCPKAEAYMESMAVQMDCELKYGSRKHCYSDHYPFILQGVATAGMGCGPSKKKTKKFVHMEGDTIDTIDADELRDVAAFAARALVRAANDEDWPDMRRSAEEVAEWREMGAFKG